MNIDEIAKIAGVSKSTVSRALNNSGYVSAKTRSRVLDTIQESGYRRNLIARNLRSKKSNFIGLIIPDIANEFFSLFAKSLETNLRKAGFALFLCNTEEKIENENFYLDSLLDNQVQAIVLTSTSHQIPKKIKYAKIPIVIADRFIEDTSVLEMCCITSDNRYGGRRAVDELFRRGAKKLLVIADERHMYGTEVRMKAACERAQEIDVSAEVRFAHVSAFGGYDVIVDALTKEHLDFDSLFCTTDIFALGALRALVEHHIRIPEEIQVIGFDGIELGAFSNPPLTTFKQDAIGMGKAAADAIVAMLHHETVQHHKLLPLEFVERSTTLAQ